MGAVVGKRRWVQLSDFCSPRRTESALPVLVVKRQQDAQERSLASQESGQDLRRLGVVEQSW